MKSLQPRHFTKPWHRKTAPNTIIACGTYTILLRHSVRLPNACSSSTFIQSTILSRAPKNHVQQNAKNNDDDDDDLFFFLFGNKCRVSAAKFLDCSRTSKTPFDFSFKEKTKKKAILFLPLSLSLSLLMRLAQAKRAENKQRAESDKE